jgi:hypothetical protein
LFREEPSDDLYHFGNLGPDASTDDEAMVRVLRPSGAGRMFQPYRFLQRLVACGVSEFPVPFRLGRRERLEMDHRVIAGRYLDEVDAIAAAKFRGSPGSICRAIKKPAVAHQQLAAGRLRDQQISVFQRALQRRDSRLKGILPVRSPRKVLAGDRKAAFQQQGSRFRNQHDPIEELLAKRFLHGRLAATRAARQDNAFHVREEPLSLESHRVKSIETNAGIKGFHQLSDSQRKRRSLTHVGGAIETAGDAHEAKRLAHALDVAPSLDDADDISRAHVHGFHTYPARMHPETAARLVRAFVPAGGRVLDPFCGSGTVLVESLILGRSSVGVDLNPLAVRLARCKSRPRTGTELERLAGRARVCSAYADAQRKSRAGASHRFGPEDVALFEPHVLLELDSLQNKLQSMGDDPAPLDLSLVLSALLVKLSRKRGDTSEHIGTRRTAPGFAARLFVQKTEELAWRFAALNARMPSPPPKPARVEQDDATELGTLRNESFDAVITSPPYAATYDYVAHHALRLRWLGLDPSALARGELGARSTYQKIDPRRARDTWTKELTRFFKAAARVLPIGKPLVMVVADSAVGSAALRADEIVAAAADGCGFVPVARASQARPHFHGPTKAAFRGQPRFEHAILLRRTDSQQAKRDMNQ